MNGDATAAPPPASLFEMMLAYKTTAVLRTGIELSVFDMLASEAMSPSDLASKLGIAERGARVLLNALSAMGLLTFDDGRFALTDAAAAYLVRGHPRFVGDMAKVMASHWEWQAMGELTSSVRAGGPVADEHAETPEYPYWEQFAAFAGAVAGPTAEFAAGLLSPWATGRSRLHILDIACGHGLYGYTLASKHPHATVCSLDWANVLPIAHRHAAQLGVADRISTIAGDMFEAPLGGPYDVVLVTNVLHHFSPERSATLLRRAADVLDEDGRLVVVGFVSRGGPPVDDAAAHLFSVLMLVWTFGGEVHCETDYHQIFNSAGFTTPELHRVPSLPLAVLVAGKKESDGPEPAARDSCRAHRWTLDSSMEA